MDTVFEKDHSFQTARITDKNCLQGPGVADMKGGLVIMLKALELFERHPISKNIGWEIIISPDEEVGSLGSKPLLFEAIKNKDIGLIFEPSFPDGSLVSSRKGSANFTVTSKGKAAHAGRNFYEGSNAIVTLAAFITEVQKLNDPKHDLTVNIGQISGGGAINIVPNFSLCHINARASTKEDFEKIPIYLQSIINKVNRDGGDLNLFIHHQNYPKPFDYKNQQLFSFLKACAGSLNQDLKWKPSGGTCDGNFLSCQGLPVIDSLGAIGGNIHTEHEYIFIDSLEIRIRLLTTFLLQIASGIFKEIKHLRENYAPST